MSSLKEEYPKMEKKPAKENIPVNGKNQANEKPAGTDGQKPAARSSFVEGSHTHTHVLEDGTVVTHTHGPSGDNEQHHHSHPHQHTNTKAVINRLSKAIGHLESVKRMVEDGRDCSEVLIQLSAVKAAINNTGKMILQDHIQHCLVDAIENGDETELEELNKAIDRFIK